ncbi:MAG TPA: hypothetical protein VL027_07480 [Spongiibacteraceae bacterium]|jgi:hypothetical protein|nr:hypothetical protein [Spongiibacteraceae bacterium]
MPSALQVWLAGSAVQQLARHIPLTSLQGSAATWLLGAALASFVVAGGLLLAALHLWVLAQHGLPAALTATGAAVLGTGLTLLGGWMAVLHWRRRKLARIVNELALLFDQATTLATEQGKVAWNEHPLAVAVSACIAGACAGQATADARTTH